MANLKLHLFLRTIVFSVILFCCCTGVHSDIPDDVVYTDLHKTVRIGDSVVLTCRFRGTPLAVYWKKGDDPRTAPNLVSWIPTDDVTGLCKGERPCQIMEMNEDYYLVIKKVSIAEEGRYICRVSSYKGILIHNFTDIKLFSPPHHPFPVIHQCAEREPSVSHSCIISTSTPINITCIASRYYPDLDLFFLHGHNKINDLVTSEWTNHDGTKSKFISIKGSASEIPYQCVASDIPGTKGQRVATVLLVLPAVSTSVDSDGLSSPSFTTTATDVTTFTATPVKIVVPMIILVMIALVGITFVLWKRHQRRGRGHAQEEGLPLVEQMPIKGVLSFYELWMMVSRVTMSDMGKLNNVFYELGIKKLNKKSTPLEAYPYLCRWKMDNAHTDQAASWKGALEKFGYGGAWKKIRDLRRNSAIRVSEGTLEHICWHIGEPAKINKFLSELIPGHSTPHFEDTDEMLKLVQKPLREMKEWSERTFDENPLTLLSLALERAGCNPVDRTFFCVPDEPISSDELHHFVQKLASRHCDRLANVVDLTRDEIATIIDEDNNDSFDAEEMINDWLANSQENSGFIEKRCALDHAAISIGRHDLKGDLVGYGNHLILSDTGQQGNNEPSEEVISSGDQDNDYHEKNVSDAELRRVCQYLDQAKLTEMFGEGDGFNAIKAWIEKESTAGHPDSCRQSLRAKLSQIEMEDEDLIPLEIKEDVCLVELADIAFRLIMMDIYPLAEALDISADQLKSYRRPSLNKLSKGTMGVLVRLGEQTKYARSKLCDALARGTGLQEMVQLLKYGKIGRSGNQTGNGIVIIQDTIMYFQASRIATILGVHHSIPEMGNLTIKQVFDIWKESPKTKSLDDDQQRNLCERLLGGGFKTFSSKLLHKNGDNRYIEKADMEKAIRFDVACNVSEVLNVKVKPLEGTSHLKQVLKEWADKLNKKPLEQRERILLSNRLLKEGYKDFSFEVMIGFVPKQGN